MVLEGKDKLDLLRSRTIWGEGWSWGEKIKNTANDTAYSHGVVGYEVAWGRGRIERGWMGGGVIIVVIVVIHT